jgi:uncharacterized membrane protein
MTVFKQAISAVGLAVYAISSHIALTQHWLWLAFFLAVAPLLLMLFGYFIQRFNTHRVLVNRMVLLLACALCCVTLLNYWASLSQFTNWIFLVQNVGMNAALGALFAYSLLPNQTPLISVFARIVHENFSPPMQRYTRQVTWAWVWFFVTMCLISMWLFYFASLTWWSVFINLLSWPLVGLMFVAEYGCRKVLHPEFEKIGIAAGVKACVSYFTRMGGK